MDIVYLITLIKVDMLQLVTTKNCRRTEVMRSSVNGCSKNTGEVIRNAASNVLVKNLCKCASPGHDSRQVV